MASPWLGHYFGAKNRCKIPCMRNYKWYGGKDIRIILTKEEVEILYKRDHADKMKQPSIDRINPSGDYHFGNCRFIEMTENIERGFRERDALGRFKKDSIL